MKSTVVSDGTYSVLRVFHGPEISQHTTHTLPAFSTNTHTEHKCVYSIGAGRCRGGFPVLV